MLNPLEAAVADLPPGYEVHQVQPNGYSFYVVVNPFYGRMLTEWAAENEVQLVWATEWEHEANRVLAPLIGLPELPVIVFPRTMSTRFPDRWKFTAVAEKTRGKNIIWFDDEFNEQWPNDLEWFREIRGKRPTRLHPIDPKVGLTARDLATASLWLKERRTVLARAASQAARSPASPASRPEGQPGATS